MVQFGFSKIVQSREPLVLLYLQDFEIWFVEVPICVSFGLVCLGLNTIANSVLTTIITGYISI